MKLHFFMKSFSEKKIGWQNPCHISNPELERIISLQFFMGIRAPDVGKNSETSLQCCETFSKIWSCFHFTRETWVALNNGYLSQFFPDCKVLWMSWKQIFEIFIKFDMFDCIRSIFTYVHVSSSTVGPFWGNSNFSYRDSSQARIASDWLDVKFMQKISKSYIINMPRTFL